MAIIRAEDLVAKKNTEYPEEPAHNACSSTRDPDMNRAGNSGCVRIELCDSTDKLGSANRKQQTPTTPGSSLGTSEEVRLREQG